MPWEKQFNIDEALERAGESFWSQGYESTSMRDLLLAMGIQKGSFYATYGSKREVYLRSLRSYSESSFEQLKELVGTQGLKALRAVFEVIYEDCVGPDGHRGCMIVNCALELAHDDQEAQKIVKRSIARQEEMFRELIVSGQEAGDIRASLDPAATAKAMMSFIMGMRVYSRAGIDSAAVRALADQAIALLAQPE